MNLRWSSWTINKVYLNNSKDDISKWGQWSIEITRGPFTTPCVTIFKFVHSVTLLAAFMPWTFIAMPIGKVIHTKTMNLVTEIFSCVSIPIPAPNPVKHQVAYEILFVIVKTIKNQKNTRTSLTALQREISFEKNPNIHY